MLRKLAVLVSLFAVVSAAFAQVNGTIKGKMLDKANGEPLPFANVVLKKAGSQVAGTMTDFDGKFTFPALTPGKYNIEATYVGYQPIKVSDVIVNANKITFIPDIQASSGSENLEEFVVIEYEIPLIDKDNTVAGGTVGGEDIKKMASRSAAAVAATVGGVYSADDGSGSLNVRGARDEGTDTYIDGVKVRGGQNLPQSAIEQVSVITGGLPAQFGDATGGVINITTRGATKEWFGGVEYLTSGFKNGDDVVGLDKFGFNLLGLSLSGPILTRKDSLGNKKEGLLGFFVSTELKHEVDPRPWVGGDWKVKDEKMEELNQNPYTQNLTEVGGVINNADFLRSEDLENTPFRLNVARKSLVLSGKIDITTSKTTNVAIGGSIDYSDGNRYTRERNDRLGNGANALLNSQNNPQQIDNTWRVWGRLTQRFANSTDEENPSLVKDAFISLQVDYSQWRRTIQSEQHQDRLSHYGYVGRFTSVRETVYNLDQFSSTVNGVEVDTVFGLLSSTETVLYNFEPGDINPILSNYTSNYYEAFANDPVDNWERPEQVQEGGGVLNGLNRGRLLPVYGMWNSMGVPYNSYFRQEQNQYRVTAMGSASIKDHAIQIGFEYEQNIDRAYSVENPARLWEVGRGLVNTQIEGLNFEQGTYDSVLVNSSQTALYQYTFQHVYNDDDGAHNTFDKNLRESLGLPEQGLDWIDFDSYGPDVWDISMFSPDELINSSGLVSNYGFDHAGNKISGNPSLDDFFTKRDENGDFLRETPAFRPIYVAGYIQDKFAFDDLVFNIGVRIDRYDANQSVLKDPYSLLPVKTVGEIQSELSQASTVTIPSNIGDDFVVYVKDAASPNAKEIAGFRSGDTWFNADGEELTDPAVLHASGVPQPWLVSPDRNNVFTDLNSESFKDFEPQVNVSPRVAFSFPISDEALFFAHYDVLTQRPSAGVNRLDLISYLAFGAGGSNVFEGGFTNPALKPEQTIDYELGFKQKLDNYSAITISAFYREMRDIVQYTQVIGAYPGNYFTFQNRDFGTVKGLTIAYDMRTRGNLTLRANYTLQFADGTGSTATTSSGLVQSGNGNLRTLAPLNFDQRHSIQVTGDYRYSGGKNYNGPVLFGKNILENVGLNMVVRAGSGLPYTKRSRVNGRNVLFDSNLQGSRPREGLINNARLPFRTTVDARLDKTLPVKWGKGEDEEKKEASLNVYLQVLNLLNARNVISVYPFTGNPDDDGFLSASYQQAYIESQTDEQSFRDLYSAKLHNGSWYALPRRIRLGIQLNF